MSKYEHRFVQVVRFIESNLEVNFDIDELCQLAHLSKYHFHRQCSAFFGMSVLSLVRLLRLKRAAYQLAYRQDEKIIDIALANGYESHEAFSRAFKRYFSKSPSEFRKTVDWTPWYRNYESIVTLRTKIMNEKNRYDVKIVDFSETLIAVMEHRGSPKALGKTIQRFIEWRKRSHLPPSISRTFNLVYDDINSTPEEDYRFDLGCSIEHAIEKNDFGIVNKVIPEGLCAVVRHVGSNDSIGSVVNYLYTHWLLNNDYELRDFPIFFEKVSFFPEVPECEMITDVYLPLRRNTE